MVSYHILKLSVSNQRKYLYIIVKRMTVSNDISQQLVEQIQQASQQKKSLKICAGNSKLFYGNAVEGETLDVTPHTGIIEYRPSELVITARSGTKLSNIEDELEANGQIFAFEPLQHSVNTTLGGVIACGLAGPRRGYSFSVRDAVLGSRIINGKGEQLKFGGQVMKNVAGYDASRLMVGAQGTLGVLLDISIKVKPKAESNITLAFEKSFNDAHDALNHWVMLGLPVRASCYLDGQLYVRICSTHSSVEKSRQIMGGELQDLSLWSQLKQQTHPFFNDSNNLWRISVPPTTPLFAENVDQLIEWNGALRWMKHDDDMFDIAAQYGGHATRYQPGETISSDDIFQPLAPHMLALQCRVKQSFDPDNILNPGRLYRDLK